MDVINNQGIDYTPVVDAEGKLSHYRMDDPDLDHDSYFREAFFFSEEHDNVPVVFNYSSKYFNPNKEDIRIARERGKSYNKHYGEYMAQYEVTADPINNYKPASPVAQGATVTLPQEQQEKNNLIEFKPRNNGWSSTTSFYEAVLEKDAEQQPIKALIGQASDFSAEKKLPVLMTVDGVELTVQKSIYEPREAYIEKLVLSHQLIKEYEQKGVSVGFRQIKDILDVMAMQTKNELPSVNNFDLRQGLLTMAAQSSFENINVIRDDNGNVLAVNCKEKFSSTSVKDKLSCAFGLSRIMGGIPVTATFERDDRITAQAPLDESKQDTDNRIMLLDEKHKAFLAEPYTPEDMKKFSRPVYDQDVLLKNITIFNHGRYGEKFDDRISFKMSPDDGRIEAICIDGVSDYERDKNKRYYERRAILDCLDISKNFDGLPVELSMNGQTIPLQALRNSRQSMEDVAWEAERTYDRNKSVAEEAKAAQEPEVKNEQSAPVVPSSSRRPDHASLKSMSMNTEEPQSPLEPTRNSDRKRQPNRRFTLG